MKKTKYFGCVTILLLIIIVQSCIPKDQNQVQKSELEDILISQYDLKKDYGWKDIILWKESKESFEKAYSTKINWINYVMGFRRDVMCSDPIGGGGDWQYDKLCFNFVWMPNMPDILDEIAYQTRGKTLVIVGDTDNNGQNFFGDVYWYE